VKDLIARVGRYYETNMAGGALHIVLDDDNVEECHIKWCIKHSIKEAKDEEALAIAKDMLKLSMRERYEVCWNNPRYHEGEYVNVHARECSCGEINYVMDGEWQCEECGKLSLDDAHQPEIETPLSGGALLLHKPLSFDERDGGASE